MPTVEIDDTILVAMKTKIVTLNKSLEGAGKAFAGDSFVPAPMFDRPNVVEAIASALHTVEQNSDLLAKQATDVKAKLEKSSADASKAVAIAERAMHVAEHLQKGHRPCKKCATVGKVQIDSETENCDKCSGTGFVA